MESIINIYDENIIDSFDLVDNRTSKYIGDIVEFDESERQWQRWFATDGKFKLDWVRGTLGGQRWTIWGEIEAKPNDITNKNVIVLLEIILGANFFDLNTRLFLIMLFFLLLLFA